MSNLKSFLHFILIEEAIPFKDSRYHWKHLKFYLQIQNFCKTAKHGICQYYIVFSILVAKLIHFAYIYIHYSNEIDRVIYFDFFGFFKMKTSNFLGIGLIILISYYIYILYFSDEFHYFALTKRKLLLLDKDYFRYNWPFNYKNVDCAEYLNKNYLKLTSLLQVFVVICGKFFVLFAF